MRAVTSSLSPGHAPILALHEEMKADWEFERLCRANGLPWDFEAGYEPRGYNGPPPADVRVLLFMAEPGAITATEATNLQPAINQAPLIGNHDLRLLEHYWRANALELCRSIWPTNTGAMAMAHLGRTCSFWMSLPPGAQTAAVPSAVVRYFSSRYLKRLLALFPGAVVISAGGKAKKRLQRIGVESEHCWAFTRPGCNRAEARESWRAAGRAAAARLAGRP